MEENQIFDERYQLIRLLGRGNFSEVWLAKDSKTHIEVALKVYAPATGLDDVGLDVFAREFSLVVNANHKNLLKPLYYDTCDRKPYLVLPFCKRGSILSQIGKFDEMDSWHLLHDVAAGLDCLHKLNPPIIHQDIKPDNVMVADDGAYMITDFGISSHVRASLRKSMSLAFASAGTIAYMAPERFGKDNSPVMASDIYSLGATTYEMLVGDTPFGDDGGLMHKKGAEVPDIKADVSDKLKQTIEKCLSLNAWDRPTAEQLEQIAAEAIKEQGAKSKVQESKRKTVMVALKETAPETPVSEQLPPVLEQTPPPPPVQESPVPVPEQKSSSPDIQHSTPVPSVNEPPKTPQTEQPAAAVPPQPSPVPQTPVSQNNASAAPGFQKPPAKVKETPNGKKAPQSQPTGKSKGKLNPLVIAGIVIAFAVIGGVVAYFLLKSSSSDIPQGGITPTQSGVVVGDGQDAQTNEQAAALVARADSLVSEGDKHGEDYEKPYLEAYEKYQEALVTNSSDEIKSKVADLKKKLNERYDNLIEKANQLEQMGESAAAAARRTKAETIKEKLNN